MPMLPSLIRILIQCNIQLLLLLLCTAPLRVLASEPLTLDTAIDLFIDNSLDLKIQNLTEQEAKGRTQQFLGIYDFILRSDVTYTKAPFVDVSTFGADVELLQSTTQLQKNFPFGVSFALGWDWDLKDTRTIITGLNIPPTRGNITGLFLELKIPLLRNIFGTLDHLQIAQFKLSEQVAKLQTLKSIVNLVQEGMNIYEQWHLAKRAVRLKEESLRRAQKLLDLNLQKLKDGLLEEGDIAQTRASLKAREIDLATAHISLNQANHIFAAFINMDEDKISAYTADELENEVALQYESTSESSVLESNIDIALAQAGEAISGLILREKSHDRLITLDAFGRTTLRDAAPTFSKSWDNLFFDKPTYVAGLSLTVPLGNTTKEYVYQNAFLGHERADIELQKAKKQVLETYRGLSFAIQKLKEQVQYSKKLLALQNEKLKHEELKFKQGRSSITFILQFQDELTAFELQHESLLTQYVKTRVLAQLVDTSLLKQHELELPSSSNTQYRP